jgi:hypothetical protein
VAVTRGMCNSLPICGGHWFTDKFQLNDGTSTCISVARNSTLVVLIITPLTFAALHVLIMQEPLSDGRSVTQKYHIDYDHQHLLIDVILCGIDH